MPIGISMTIQESELTGKIEVESVGYNFVFIKQDEDVVEVRQCDVPDLITAIQLCSKQIT